MRATHETAAQDPGIRERIGRLLAVLALVGGLMVALSGLADARWPAPAEVTPGQGQGCGEVLEAAPAAADDGSVRTAPPSAWLPGEPY